MSSESEDPKPETDQSEDPKPTEVTIRVPGYMFLGTPLAILASVLLLLYSAGQQIETTPLPPPAVPLIQQPSQPVKPADEKKEEVKPKIVPEMWILTKPDGSREKNPAVEKMAENLTEGVSYAQAIPKPGDIGYFLKITIERMSKPPPSEPIVDPSQPDPSTTIPSGKLVAIFCHEASDKLGPGFDASSKVGTNGTVTDPAIWAYLNSHCGTGPDKTPNRRFWDIDVNTINERSPVVRDTWAKAKPLIKHLPSVILANEVTGAFTIYDVPTVPTETFKLLESKGGK